MKTNDRIRKYAADCGIDMKGAFKNKSSTDKVKGKLTPRQQRRLKKKV